MFEANLVESVGSGEVLCVLILLHGLGANPDDLLPLGRSLCPEGRAMRLVALSAPRIPLSVFGGQMVRSWFDMDVLDWNAPLRDEAGVMASCQRVFDAVDEQMKDGFSPHQIFLCGFSQGGCVVLRASMMMSHHLGGVLALSTFIRQQDLNFEIKQKEISLFWGEGIHDVVIPEPVRKETQEILHKMFPHSLTHKKYVMGHQVSAEEIEDLKVWVRERLAL